MELLNLNNQFKIKMKTDLINESPNSINVALHRLKQKCKFESTIDFKKYIEGF